MMLLWCSILCFAMYSCTEVTGTQCAAGGLTAHVWRPQIAYLWIEVRGLILPGEASHWHQSFKIDSLSTHHTHHAFRSPVRKHEARSLCCCARNTRLCASAPQNAPIIHLLLLRISHNARMLSGRMVRLAAADSGPRLLAYSAFDDGSRCGIVLHTQQHAQVALERGSISMASAGRQ